LKRKRSPKITKKNVTNKSVTISFGHKKNGHKMNLIESLKKRFGLSQSDLAKLAGASRSLLALPEGPSKKQNAKKLRRARYDLENLQDRQGKNNPVAVMRRAADVQALGAQIVIYQTLKAEVEAHMATL
jgi:transcriptional regulator with XRE-family HTH domain